MGLSTKITAGEKELKELARNLGNTFAELRERVPIIGLYGYNAGILEQLRTLMQDDLRSRGIDVAVQIGQIGYKIDVGFYID